MSSKWDAIRQHIRIRNNLKDTWNYSIRDDCVLELLDERDRQEQAIEVLMDGAARAATIATAQRILRGKEE